MKLFREKALEFTFNWNRVDLAKSEILTDDNIHLCHEQLEDIIIRAIKTNNVEFVQVLLKQDVKIDELFQNDRLYREHERFYSDYKYQVNLTSNSINSTKINVNLNI